ncbi:hypothetical protein CEXT_540551 [Caerostris extrusa]|uniref:Uncharacterized protein n=1 Tax=Caerostris extrusa TaxID=172846 RepID=A0AAV4NC52_CAEEX|nr:hypothetical protein CEXT_540551 [Caerostris extrusa]
MGRPCVKLVSPNAEVVLRVQWSQEASWQKGSSAREKTTKCKEGWMEMHKGEWKWITVKKFLAQSGIRLLEFGKKCRDM